MICLLFFSFINLILSVINKIIELYSKEIFYNIKNIFIYPIQSNKRNVKESTSITVFF